MKKPSKSKPGVKAEYAVKSQELSHPLKPKDTAPPAPPAETPLAKEVKEAKEATADLADGLSYELHDLDRVMLKNIALSPGISNVELARILNISAAKVGAHRNKPVFQDALARLSKTTGQLLEEAALKGSRKLIELIDHWEPDIALAAAKLALTPMMKTQVEVAIKPITVFRTTVTPEGSLLQDMIDEEVAAKAELEKAQASKLKPKKK